MDYFNLSFTYLSREKAHREGRGVKLVYRESDVRGNNSFMRLAGRVLITLITWRSQFSALIPLSFAATDQAVHHCRTIARHLKSPVSSAGRYHFSPPFFRKPGQISPFVYR